MSMRSWTEDGYGFPLYNGKNAEQIARFVLNNCDSAYEYDDEQLNEILQACKDDDWAVYERLFDESASWVIARIINDKENTSCFRGYDACGDTDQDEYLGIEPMYHWMATEGDKKIKHEDDAFQLLAKYAAELGITEDPDYFTAYYCG